MSYILRNVRPNKIQSWVKTNAPGSVRGTPYDSWRAYLVANGGVGRTIVDIEYSFLKAQGVTSGKTLADQWGVYVNGTSGSKTREKLRNLYQ